MQLKVFVRIISGARLRYAPLIIRLEEGSFYSFQIVNCNLKTLSSHFYAMAKERQLSRYNGKSEEAIDGVPLSLGSTLICLPTHC